MPPDGSAPDTGNLKTAKESRGRLESGQRRKKTAERARSGPRRRDRPLAVPARSGAERSCMIEYHNNGSKNNSKATTKGSRAVDSAALFFSSKSLSPCGVAYQPSPTRGKVSRLAVTDEGEKTVNARIRRFCPHYPLLHSFFRNYRTNRLKNWKIILTI